MIINLALIIYYYTVYIRTVFYSRYTYYYNCSLIIEACFVLHLPSNFELGPPRTCVLGQYDTVISARQV